MSIEKSVNEYGFENIVATTDKGGRVSITYFGEMESVDIGRLSVMNEKGLGSSEYIRSKDDITNKKVHITGIVWITEE